MRQATIVVDLGYGDAGKGSTVDYLCRMHGADLVVFFNGGSQRAHNVVTPDGRHHTFAQFGSGTFAGAATHHSKYSMVDLDALDNEAQALDDLLGTRNVPGVSVDPEALLITPYHVWANRIKELIRNEERHGSCGMGIGECMSNFLRYPEAAPVMRDIDNPKSLANKLGLLKVRLYREFEGLVMPNDLAEGYYHDLSHEDPDVLAARLSDSDIQILPTWRALAAHDQVVFEGSQGVLIDQKYGFAPYHTWSNCTFVNADTVIDEYERDGPVERTRLGVLRTYGVRHGPGPFPGESAQLTGMLREPHNQVNEWQREFRAGYIDFPMINYAIQACGGVDGLVLTHLDKLAANSSPLYLGVHSYVTDKRDSYDPEQWIVRVDPSRAADYSPVYRPVPLYSSGPYGTPESFIEGVEQRVSVPVRIGSWGPTALDKRYLWT